jgi:hypothetical protein
MGIELQPGGPGSAWGAIKRSECTQIIVIHLIKSLVYELLYIDIIIAMRVGWATRLWVDDEDSK